jgi:hypothetical protein
LPLNTFRQKYDAWHKSGDWLVLVNRSKAGALWQVKPHAVGLPDAFVKYCASVIGQFKRADAQRQAIFSIHRHWKTGHNNRGQSLPIPGYEKDWGGRNPEILPLGWHETNIRRQIKQRGALPKAVAGLLTQGTAAAIAHIAQVRSTRSALRFMEHIQFDDVKTDWRVMVDGVVCDLWLLVARDLATGVLLGFGLRPARVREDGSQEHLKLQDMKQLLGWLFEHYGLASIHLPSQIRARHRQHLERHCRRYLRTFWKPALRDPPRSCHFSSMLGGTAPVRLRRAQSRQCSRQSFPRIPQPPDAHHRR